MLRHDRLYSNRQQSTTKEDVFQRSKPSLRIPETYFMDDTITALWAHVVLYLPTLPPQFALVWQRLQHYNSFYQIDLWLLLYYPLFTSAKYVSQDDDQNIEQASIIERGYILSILLVALCYRFYVCFFSRHELLPVHHDSQEIQEEVPAFEKKPEFETVDWDAAIKSGLRDDEVAIRRKKYGTNRLKEKRNWLQVFKSFVVRSHILIVEVSESL
jgi:hypothetical protein